jgi:hypothetical protein
MDATRHGLSAALTSTCYTVNISRQHFFSLFLEVQSHMCFTAWDVTRRGRIVNGFEEGDGGKKPNDGTGRGGGHREQAASLLLRQLTSCICGDSEWRVLRRQQPGFHIKVGNGGGGPGKPPCPCANTRCKLTKQVWTPLCTPLTSRYCWRQFRFSWSIVQSPSITVRPSFIISNGMNCCRTCVCP